MKIILVTVGSRGDVQPMLALSLALKARGHDVLLAGPPERAPWAKEHGCPYRPLGRDVTSFIDGSLTVRNPLAVPIFYRFLRTEIQTQFDVLPRMIEGMDLVVGASLSFGLASVAEAAGIPYRFIAFTPQLLPSDHHPCPIFKSQHLPSWINRVGWRLAEMMDRLNITWLINHHRRKFGLKPIKSANANYLGRKTIVATDRILADIPPDVPMDAVQTGYMHLPQPAGKLPVLEDFLSDGPSPVFAGFGSMPLSDQSRMTPLVIEAARLAGRRVVIGRPWKASHKYASDKQVLFIRQYPHQALFPRMAAVIHHGGAGTTATTAISGVPQIIVPFILDQYFWGDRIFRAGLGPAPIYCRRISARKLARAIRVCLDNPQMKQKAMAVQGEIMRQDGVEKTVEELVGPRR